MIIVVVTVVAAIFFVAAAAVVYTDLLQKEIYCAVESKYYCTVSRIRVKKPFTWVVQT